MDDETWESDDEYKSDGPQPTKNEETHLTGDLDQKASTLMVSLFTVALMYSFIGESIMVAFGKDGGYDRVPCSFYGKVHGHECLPEC